MIEEDLIYEKVCEILDGNAAYVTVLTCAAILAFDDTMRKKFDYDVKSTKTISREIRAALKNHKDIEIDDHGVMRKVK